MSPAPDEHEEVEPLSTHDADGLPGEAGAPQPLGPALVAARERAGRTVEQLSARTRIRPAILRDLERGELASCRGHVYARGLVRSIAQALGVAPAPLLAAVDALAGVPAPARAAAPAVRAAPDRALRVPTAVARERSGPRWGAALVATLSVLVVLLGIGAVVGRDPRPPAPVDELLAGASPTPTVSPRPSRPLTAAVPRTGARLRVRALDGSSWMRVQGSSGTLFEGVLRAGAAPKDFTDAGQLRLIVGNAAALSVVCGGKDLAPAGGAGVVRRFTCSADGLAAA